MYDEQEDAAQLEWCQQFGQMVVADVIYTKVNDTPYDFMQ